MVDDNGDVGDGIGGDGDVDSVRAEDERNADLDGEADPEETPDEGKKDEENESIQVSSIDIGTEDPEEYDTAVGGDINAITDIRAAASSFYASLRSMEFE